MAEVNAALPKFLKDTEGVTLAVLTAPLGVIIAEMPASLASETEIATAEEVVEAPTLSNALAVNEYEPIATPDHVNE